MVVASDGLVSACVPRSRLSCSLDTSFFSIISEIDKSVSSLAPLPIVMSSGVCIWCETLAYRFMLHAFRVGAAKHDQLDVGLWSRSTG